MKFFAIPNHSAHEVEIVDPTTMKLLEKYAPTKEEFRKWEADPSTRHCFYSTIEALIPSLRVSIQNPPKLMYGLIADYDARVTPDMVASIADNAAPGMLPTWTSRTFSGGARAIFEFAEPILVDTEALAERFLRILSKELKLKNLLPGLDTSPHSLARYFELGRDWLPVKGGAPIPGEVLGLMMFKAAMEKSYRGEGPLIPIEEVAAEVDRQYPGRWPGEFKLGARGPLFWINDGIDRIGCQVGEFGMVCYSDRAGKGFMHWGEILGQQFVREYEASRIGAAAEGLNYDGKFYWRRLDSGRWISKPTEECIRDLKVRGISANKGPKETASDVDKVLITAQRHDLDGAVPFVHNKSEIVNVNGRRFLNISCKSVVQPEPGEFPWLQAFFDNIWDENHPEQRDYFLAWFQRFYRSAYEGCLQSGQAVVIAGAANKGKTLLSKVIIGEAVGGSTDASKYLLGETAFNKEAAEMALWRVDDSKGSATWEKHAEFSNALKATVANPQASYHPKFRDSMLIPWSGRIILTCNADPRSLDILPAMNATIEDKICLFKFGSWQPQFYDNRRLEALIASELPHFLEWLLRWEAPAEVDDPENPRYGVKSYHHPELLDAAKDAAPDARLRELLLIWKKAARNKPDDPARWLTATELRNSMVLAGLGSDLKEFGRNRLSQALREVGPEFVVEIKSDHKVTKFLMKMNDL